MEAKWLIKNCNPKLLVFYSGWAFDEQCVAHLCSENSDIVVLYDYRNLNFPIDINNYQQIELIAWSFGIWVAEHSFPGNLSPVSATAIHGSIKAVDDYEGIRVEIFTKTLQTLNPVNFRKFLIRVFGGIKAFQDGEKFLPNRCFEDQKEELEKLAQHFNRNPKTNIKWTKSIISENDAIFPIENLKQNCKGMIEITNNAHFPFSNYINWNQITKCK